jgi:hypothetical protein
MTDLMTMTEEEFNDECWNRCPPELKEKFAAAAHRGKDAAPDLNEQLAREFVAAIGPELTREARAREIQAAITAVLPIGKIFELAGGNDPVPRSLSGLELPLAAPISGGPPYARRYKLWLKLTWAQLEAVRRVLVEDRAWGALNAVVRICRAVEPIMRGYPARTLGEAFSLLAQGENAPTT